MHATELNKVINGLQIRAYTKGRTVYFQGEAPRVAYFIKKGMVRAYNIGEGGEELTLAFYRPGDIIPIGWLYDATHLALYYYEATQESELVAISKDWWHNEAPKHPDFWNYVNAQFHRNIVGASLHINALEHTKAAEKILHSLHFLAIQYGHKLKNGLYEIELRLTHQDIAGMVGLTRETTAIELGKLKKRGLITYNSFHYSVNLEMLIRMTGSDEFESLHPTK